ncbi:MAG: PHP domain-containing protein [Acutalibacteraceae bacterium]|nr:PHP domain-containing protein [Acutalibacteraceae bacterium]
MSRYYYDFHVHSCLSPCADDDNTPNNLAGMANICGINVMAVTDHNSCKNCPAFFAAAKKYGIIPIAGMELTTAEDIHLVCLFEELDNAMLFDKELDKYRTPFKNRVDIFGNQSVMDENDNITDVVDDFLPVATTVMLEDAVKLVNSFGGICYPAHIDRQANGIIATLGIMPDTPYFSCVEFHNSENIDKYKKLYDIKDKKILVSSDAHYLTDLREDNDFFEIDDEPYSSTLVRKKLFERLR